MPPQGPSEYPDAIPSGPQQEKCTSRRSASATTSRKEATRMPRHKGKYKCWKMMWPYLARKA